MNHKNERRRTERLKIIAGIAAVSFAVTLAVIVGDRLTDESLAVLAGAVCGVSAAIPTSLLVIWVTRRQFSQPPTQTNSHISTSQPPIVVVAPPGAQPHTLAPPPSPIPTPLPSPPRAFTIVGDDYE